MVEKVVTRLSFIGGRLIQPGESIDVDAEDPSIILAAPSTPVGNLSVEDLEALLRAKKKTAADSANLADPSPTTAGVSNVPIADIGPRSAGSIRPQGAPPGAVEINGQFSGPVADNAPGAREDYLPPDAAPGIINPPDLDGDGKPGGSLTKGEIIDALRERGDAVDTSKSKAELQSQLATPPEA